MTEASVIIACRNGANTIGKQLEALATQRDAPDFEVIVVDNNSTDDLRGACRPFEARLNLRITAAPERAGAAYARNVGVRLAQSDFVLFCDADDVVGSRWVAGFYQALAVEDCVVTGPLQAWNGEDPAVFDEAKATSAPLMKGTYLPTAGGQSCGYRRLTYIELGGMEMGYRGGCEDVDLSWRVQESGRSLRFVPSSPVLYRVRTGGSASLIQHYRWNREDVRLWALGVQRGEDSHIVSLQGAVKRLATVPSHLWRSRKDPIELTTVGCIFGSLAGHADYRFPGRTPVADLFPPRWYQGHESLPPSHVTFLANSMSAPNGVVSSVDALAIAFEDSGAHVKVLTFGDADTEFRNRLHLTRLRPWHALTTDIRGFDNSKAQLKPIRKLLTPLVLAGERAWARRVLKQLPQDGLVIASGMECLEYLSHLGVIPVPCAVQVHTAIESLSEDQVARLRRCASLASCVTVLTESDVEALARLGITNGIAIPNANALGQQPVSSKRNRVVYAGRLDPLKQVDHIIRSFGKVAPADWALDIYGIGPCENELRGLAERTGGIINFHGYESDRKAIFGDAALHVMTSQYEGLPMSIIEAAAFGVPTVTYESSPGTRVAVGDHGVCVPLNDEDAFARTLGSLMASTNEREARSVKAYADRRFDADNIVAAWSKLCSMQRRIVDDE